MSATATAATAVLTVAAAAATNNGTGEGGRRWEDQTRGQRDLYTQFIISSALGLGAFLTFCVRPTGDSRVPDPARRCCDEVSGSIQLDNR